MAHSEIRQLRERIEQEFVSMRLGLYGLAAGVAKHQFIEARMHQAGSYEDQLATHVGEEQAALFTCWTYIQLTTEGEGADYCG